MTPGFRKELPTRTPRESGALRAAGSALLTLLIPLLAATSAGGQTAERAQAAFGGKCYSCHNVGGGDKQGPDLKGVTERRSKEWLHEFIKTPAAMNSKGDPAAQELFRKFAPTVMPDQPLSAAEIDEILALVADLTKRNETFVPPGAKLARAVLPEDVPAGMELFTGRAPLSNGGTACISCHGFQGAGALGGGTLGPDLTGVSVKYRDPELISILQNPNFPVMASVFGQQRLSDEEIVRLFALFQDARVRSPGAAAAAVQPTGARPRVDPAFLFVGVALLVLSLVTMNLIWRNRLRGVREAVVRRSAQ
jgi:mono/diheme cytochrome c family protein